MIELTFLEELMLTSQANQKSAIFVSIDWYFSNQSFKFQSYICNRCHDLLMMYMNFSDIAISKLEMLIIVVLLVKLAKVKL